MMILITDYTAIFSQCQVQCRAANKEQVDCKKKKRRRKEKEEFYLPQLIQQIIDTQQKCQWRTAGKPHVNVNKQNDGT